MKAVIIRALRLSITLSEEDYERIADRILLEISYSSESYMLRTAIGECPFRFVARFASLNGREWGRLLRVSYSLAGGVPSCACYYCQKENGK